MKIVISKFGYFKIFFYSSLLYFMRVSVSSQCFFLLSMYRHFFLTSYAFINWHTLIILYCMCYFICMHILVTTSYLHLSIPLLFYFLYNLILQTNYFAQISSCSVLEFFKKILIPYFSDTENLGFIFDLQICRNRI